MKNQNFETKRPKRFKQNLWGVKLKLRFKRSWGPSNSRKAASLKSCESSQSPGTSTKHVDTLTHSWLLLIFKSYANSLSSPKLVRLLSILSAKRKLLHSPCINKPSAAPPALWLPPALPRSTRRCTRCHRSLSEKSKACTQQTHLFLYKRDLDERVERDVFDIVLRWLMYSPLFHKIVYCCLWIRIKI